MARKFEVWESNGGGLTMFVWDASGENLVYAHSGYEFVKGQLTEDIDALKNGTDPEEDWEGNCFFNGTSTSDWEEFGGLEAVYNDISNSEDCEMVADNGGIYRENMGRSALEAFEISEV